MGIPDVVPRQDGESDHAYARRLHEQRPDISWNELSLLSGAARNHLCRDPAMLARPMDLAAIRDAVPRRDGESDHAYARRLHEQRPGLSLSELSLLSGALRGDPAFQALPGAQVAIRDAVPRQDREADHAYARPLHQQRPGLSPSLSEPSLLSGASENNLSGDPAFQALFRELAAIRDDVPRRDGESNQAYARRLHQQRPDLNRCELSLLSGASESRLRRDPAFQRSS
jgi:hypothetical protein